MFVGIDPAKTTILSQQMRAAGRQCEEIATEVQATLQLAVLPSSAPSRLSREGTDLERVGAVLITRAELAQGFEIDLDLRADLLGVDRDRFRQAVAEFQDPNRDPDANPLLDLIATTRVLFGQVPTSIRETAKGLPDAGADPELDAAIARFDADILPRIQNGEQIDASQLSKQQRRDLTLIAIALGGDSVIVTTTELRRIRVEQGDNELRAVEVRKPLTEADPDTILSFVAANTSPNDIETAALDPGQQTGTDPVDGGGDDGDGGDDRGGGEADEPPPSREDEVVDKAGGLVGSKDQDFTRSVTDNGDGSFDVEFTDRETGVSYTGTYTETEDGRSIDVDFTDPTGKSGSLDVTTQPGGATRTETFPDGTTRTTTYDENGNQVSDKITPPGPEKPEKEGSGGNDEVTENRNSEGDVVSRSEDPDIGGGEQGDDGIGP